MVLYVTDMFHWKIAWLLVCFRGEVLGRRSLGVRVCSCPRRDMEKEEAELRSSPGGPPPRKKAMLQAPPPPSPSAQVSCNLNYHTIFMWLLHKMYTLVCGCCKTCNIIYFPKNEYCQRNSRVTRRNTLYISAKTPSYHIKYENSSKQSWGNWISELP